VKSWEVEYYLATINARKTGILRVFYNEQRATLGSALIHQKTRENMRHMNLRISDARKRLADHVYNQRVVDLGKYYSHVDVNEITFYLMRETEKRQYIEIYAEWMKLKVRARKETYLEAFKDEDVIPNEADLNEMIFAFQDVVDDFTNSLPQELSETLRQIGIMHAIEDARRDIEIFAQNMTIKQLQAEKRQQPRSVHHHIHIGENRGPIQQGGSGNTQTTTGSDNETK
jgi:2'-5' RNA ligase